MDATLTDSWKWLIGMTVGSRIVLGLGIWLGFLVVNVEQLVV